MESTAGQSLYRTQASSSAIRPSFESDVSTGSDLEGNAAGSRTGRFPVPSTPFDDDDDLDDMEHPTIAKAASSSFDFTPLSQSFPLSISLSKDDQDLETNMGLFEGLSIIIGMSIGSGIFASPGPVLGYTESVGAALSVWLIAGLLALTGSLCYAELGTMYPISGGEHPYLLKAYGTLPAFLFSWTGVVCTRPGSIAIITMIFAEYVVRLIYYGHPGGVAPVWLTRLIAALCIAVLTLLNCLSTRLGTWVQNIFTSLKLVSLLVIGGIGCVILAEGASKSHNYDREPFQGSSTNPGDYALALYSALWAYDGWNNLNIVTGELRNPTRTLPQATIAGPLIIMVCYLLTNLAYYAVLPEDVIVKSASVAMDFGKNVFGHVGGIIIPIIVIGSTFGAANGSVFTSARVLMASAKHGDIPPVFAQVHPRFKTPLNALVIQGLISVFFVSVGSFTSLVTFYSMIAWTFYLLAVLGLLLLRYRAPNLERPFRVWIIVPVIFCASTLFLIVFSVMEAPKEALAAFLFFASGVPIWYVGEVLGMTWERIGDGLYRVFGTRLGCPGGDIQYIGVSARSDEAHPGAPEHVSWIRRWFMRTKGYQEQVPMEDLASET